MRRPARTIGRFARFAFAFTFGLLTGALAPRYADALAAGASPDAGAATPPAAASATYHLLSPDGRIDVTVSVGARLGYDVAFQGKPMLSGATLSLDVDHVRLGVAPRVTAAARDSVARTIKPAVRQKAAVLDEKYNELRLTCAGGYAVAFRAYDQGVAYRFETKLPKAAVTVYGEEATFPFATAAGSDLGAYFPQEDGFFSHNERKFPRQRLAG